MSFLDQELLRSLVDYDPEAGVLTWRRRAETDRFVKTWNRRYAGQKVESINGHGYIQANITLDGVKKRYEVHRLVWLYVYGVLPACDVDHIDRNKTNNCVTNLRLANKVQTAHNVGLTTRNSSGIKGVNWHKASRKWIARISFCGKQMYLGTFDDLCQAEQAYVTASVAYARDFSIFKSAEI